MKHRIKILIPVVILTLLFIGSFIMQTKFNPVIMNAVTGHGAETLFLKQIVILGTSFAFMNLLIGSIVICFTAMILILFFVLFNRRRMEKRAKIKEELTVKYQKLILDAIDDKIISEEDFNKICNSQFKRNILIDQIIDVALMMPKDVLGKLRKLYFHLGLIDDTKRKLYSRKWHKKVKAMKELSHLEIVDYNEKVMKYINSKNDVLRMESQIAMVRLSGAKKDAFSFLEQLTYPFSVWEQITLHELMVEANITPPYFGRWLVSDNHSVGMFCLRMMREYEQLKTSDDLNNMLYHPNEKVVKLAIEVVGDLQVKPLCSSLKKIYKDEPYENKLQIIKTLGKIANTKTISFLQNVVDIEDDTELQIEGVKAIKNMGGIGDAQLKKMMNSDYKNYNIIIKHVLDKKIN